MKQVKLILTSILAILILFSGCNLRSTKSISDTNNTIQDVAKTNQQKTSKDEKNLNGSWKSADSNESSGTRLEIKNYSEHGFDFEIEAFLVVSPENVRTGAIKGKAYLEEDKYKFRADDGDLTGSFKVDKNILTVEYNGDTTYYAGLNVQFGTEFKKEENQTESNLEADKISFKIDTKTYIDKNQDVKINYPQIVNLADKDKMEKINDLLEKEALKVLNYYSDDNGLFSGLSLEIEYEIKLKNENFLSITYAGMGMVQGAAHPNNTFYSTNIDMNNARLLKLKDLVNIDGNFVEKFHKSQRISFSDADESDDKALKEHVKTSYDDQRLIYCFNNSDSLDNIGSESQTDTFSYLTKDSLGISLSFGHAVGDHMEFEMKFTDIKENLKVDSLLNVD